MCAGRDLITAKPQLCAAPRAAWRMAAVAPQPPGNHPVLPYTGIEHISLAEARRAIDQRFGSKTPRE